MNQLLTETIVKKVKKVMLEESLIEVEASGRHIHLSREAIDYLFGIDYQLTPAKELSQPGQFACKERLAIKGPKGKIENVVILGPERKESQVEVSLTDAVALGINAPVRESGDIEGTPAVTLIQGARELELDKGLIAAKRHIHVHPDDAEKMNLENREIVQVKVLGKRQLVFDDVVVRISQRFRTYMHIDFDEANACGFEKGTLGKVIKKNSGKTAEQVQLSTASAQMNNEGYTDQEATIDKKVITEKDLQKVFLKNVKNIQVPASSIITPLANDYIRTHRLQIQRSEENAG
jgi:propanediol utilization protein